MIGSESRPRGREGRSGPALAGAWGGTPPPGWVAEVQALGILALLALTLAALAALGGSLLGADRLGVELRDPAPPSPQKAGEILLANLAVLGLLVGPTALRAWLRSEPGGGGTSRLTEGIADVTVAAVIGLNAIYAGTLIGALGPALLGRILAHAPLELGGFALGALLYLRERRVGLRLREARALLVVALALLISAAIIESYASGGLA